MNILIAEDNRAERIRLEKLLSHAGYEVMAARDGSEAWEIFREHMINMVITDWMMPVMDGMDLCRRIRSHDAAHYTYIIMLTARDQKRQVVEALNQGADDFVSKPFDSDELKARINTGERILLLEKNHRKLLADLTNSRNKLMLVFDVLNEEIVSIDRDLRVVSANRSYVHARGIRFMDIIGQPYFTDNHDESFRAKVEEAFQTGEPQFLTHVTEDGKGNRKYCEIACTPVKDASGTVYQVVIVSRDITDVKAQSNHITLLDKKIRQTFDHLNSKSAKLQATLKELRATQAQVIHSEKMASIGMLAAGVAHEINNPTGFVSSNLRSLLDYQHDLSTLLNEYRRLLKELQEMGKDLAPSVFRQMARISDLEREIDADFILGDILDLIEECREGTERIKKIVLNLKDFAHPGEDRIQLADINKGIESTLNVVWNELKYKAEVKKDLGDLPKIRCYPQQLNQVFMNLLVNAAQAIEDRGEIRIKTRALDGQVEIKIEDTGPGIPKENLSRIFEPFFTTKEVGKGTGLGLNVAYNIVEKHKGTIQVESEVGKGTTFTIRIPVDGPENGGLPAARGTGVE